MKAGTEQELEALGRNYLRNAEAKQAQVQAVRQGAGQVAAVVAGALRRVGEADLQAERLRRAQDEAVQRTAAGFAKTAVRALRPGSNDDPGPGRLAAEWATGLGPQKRVMEPDSSFSREFVEAPSVRGHLRDYLSDWAQREGGLVGEYVNPPDRRARFGANEFAMDLEAGNGASHFVGSWGVHGERRGDQVDWEAENDTDTTSFFYGTPLRKAGLPVVPSYARPLPGGRIHQSIRFSTDLEGRPINRRR